MRRTLIGPVAVLLALPMLAVAAPTGALDIISPPQIVTTPREVSAGTPIAGDIPIVGDWNGDGTTTVGVRRKATFFLRNKNTTGVADATFDYGVESDRPLAGDWNGDGVTTVGVRRGAEFYLRNSNDTGTADATITFGLASDFPIVGDWDGDGTTTIGVYRNNVFYLRNSNTSGPADVIVAMPISEFFGVGGQPVVGDWDGNGTTTVGLYISIFADVTPRFFGRNTNTSGPPELLLLYGTVYDSALAGDWNGDGVDTVGVRRSSEFYLTDTALPDVSANSSGTANVTLTYGAKTLFFTGIGP